MADVKDRKITVHAVDLIKSSFGTSLTGIDMSFLDEAYVCLGHMDILRVRAVELKNEVPIFACILKDLHEMDSQSDPYRHIYPLYVLHDASKQVTDFWKCEYPCMVVSRVHCDPPQTGDEGNTIEKTLIGCIKDKFRDPAEDGKIGDLSVKVGGHTIHCLFCQTLELGDTTIILKSNSLSACVEISQCMMGHSAVGDVYSYCGLHERLFYRISERFGKFKDGEDKIRLALEEPLQHVTMRFAVRSKYYADRFWKNLNVANKVCYINGTSDALIDLSGKSCLELIEIIKVLHLGNFDGDVNEYSVQDAFDDVVTRVGIPYDLTGTPVKPSKDLKFEREQLKKAQSDIVNNLSEIISQLKEKNYDWMLALSSQVRILLTLMYNCIMDDLSLLIWPSANAFVNRLRFIVDDCETLTSDKIEETKSFLDGWMTLTNDIIHLEIQLMQDPKLQAPRVHVPAALLAYYMAFLDELNRLLTEMDRLYRERHPEESIPAATHYVPLIAHNIGSRPNTLCIHDPVDNIDDGYTGDCALLVSLPVSLMYCPKEVIVIFCHEYLHYSGEVGRQREKRLDCILRTCAHVLLNRWHLDGRNSDVDAILNINDACAYLEKKIKEKINHSRGNEMNGLYLYPLELELPVILQDLYLDWELQSEMISKFAGISLETGLTRYVHEFTAKKQVKSIEILRSRCRNMFLFYRECYADVAAILCLDLEICDYLRSTFQQELEVKEKYKKAKGLERIDKRYEFLKIQKAVVCSTVWPEVTAEDFKEWPEKWVEISQYIEQIKKEEDLSVANMDGRPEDTKADPQIILMQAEYLPLLGYLETCASELRKNLDNEEIKPRKEHLRKMYMDISRPDIDLGAFRREIDNYHLKLRHEIEDR